MKPLASSMLGVLLALSTVVAASAEVAKEIGPGNGSLVGDTESGGCGTFYFYADGTARVPTFV